MNTLRRWRNVFILFEKQSVRIHLDEHHLDPSGRDVFILTESAVYELSICKIDKLTQAHIHLGRRDENGPVVAFLYASGEQITENPSGEITFFVKKGCIKESDLVGPLEGRSFNYLLREMKKGNAYINVHTSTNPGGEVRGQIRYHESKSE